MKEKRLLMLADELERLARSKSKKLPLFNLWYWGVQNPSKKGKTPTKLTCATAACAVGTAMLLPKFRKLGLKAEVEDNGYMLPVFGKDKHFHAVTAFFGIEVDKAEMLFLPDFYLDKDRKGKRGERAVAARIREFVASKGTKEYPESEHLLKS